MIHIKEVKRSEGVESLRFHGSVKSAQPYKKGICINRVLGLRREIEIKVHIMCIDKNKNVME